MTIHIYGDIKTDGFCIVKSLLKTQETRCIEREIYKLINGYPVQHIHFNNLHYIIENILNTIPNNELSLRSSPQLKKENDEEKEEEKKLNEIINNMMNMVSEIRKKKLQDNISQDKLLASIMYSFMLQDENSILNKPNEEIIPESYLDLDNITKPFDINDVD